MKRRGTHRQLSVFLVKTNQAGMKRLISELDKIIDPVEDSVVVAPVGRGEHDRLIEIGVKGVMPGAQTLII